MLHRSIRWVALGDERLPALAEGALVQVRAGGHVLAVARVDGILRAMDDRCPHQGARLSGGHVEDGHVVCPVHRFRFHCTTGACRMDLTPPVRVHPVRETEARVEVGLPATELRLFGRCVWRWGA